LKRAEARKSSLDAGTDSTDQILDYLTVADLVDDQLGAAAFEHQRSGALVLPPLHSESRLKGNRSHIWVPFAPVDDQEALVGQGHRTVCASIPALDDNLDNLVIVKGAGENEEGALAGVSTAVRQSAYSLTNPGRVDAARARFGIRHRTRHDRNR
jgi:hypothetical protein